MRKAITWLPRFAVRGSAASARARRLWRKFGNDGAIENAHRDAEELMRMLTAIDALSRRVAARSAVYESQRAA